jgi:hypothetical protein
MARGNDGIMTGSLPYPRQANQDKVHFRLGRSPAKPAKGYFADAAGLSSEQQIVEAIAGLTTPQEIEDALENLLGSPLARNYMKWRMKDDPRMKGNPK